MELADGERVFFHGHPSWRSKLPFYLKGLLAAIAAGIVAGLVSSATSGAVESGWVVAAVLVVFIAVLGSGLVSTQRTTYTITNRRLTIETGFVARDLRETRLEHVQNVRARQSSLERLAGVGTVGFDTAGGAGFDFAFSGIAEPRRLVRTIDQALHERVVVGGFPAR